MYQKMRLSAEHFHISMSIHLKQMYSYEEISATYIIENLVYQRHNPYVLFNYGLQLTVLYAKYGATISLSCNDFRS